MSDHIFVMELKWRFDRSFGMYYKFRVLLLESAGPELESAMAFTEL